MSFSSNGQEKKYGITPSLSDTRNHIKMYICTDLFQVHYLFAFSFLFVNVLLIYCVMRMHTHISMYDRQLKGFLPKPEVRTDSDISDRNLGTVSG